jgi:hypothetical protein
MTSFAHQLDTLAAKHRARGVFLDTNVLLLFIFAAFMPAKIEDSKRLAKYDIASAEILYQYVSRFDKVLTTAHVLAETSNLARQNVKGKLWQQMSEKLYPLFCLVSGPIAIRKVDTAKIPIAIFTKLGLTDAAIVSSIGPDFLLTDDLDLYREAILGKKDAINFTHMREAAGLF